MILGVCKRYRVANSTPEASKAWRKLPPLLARGRSGSGWARAMDATPKRTTLLCSQRRPRTTGAMGPVVCPHAFKIQGRLPPEFSTWNVNLTSIYKVTTAKRAEHSLSVFFNGEGRLQLLMSRQNIRRFRSKTARDSHPSFFPRIFRPCADELAH